MVDAGFKKF